MNEEGLFAQLREVAKILSREIGAPEDSAVFTPDFIFSSELRRIEAKDLASDDEWFAYSTGATFAFAKGVTLSEFLDLYKDGRLEFRMEDKLSGIVENGYVIEKRRRREETPPPASQCPGEC